MKTQDGNVKKTVLIRNDKKRRVSIKGLQENKGIIQLLGESKIKVRLRGLWGIRALILSTLSLSTG